MTPLSEKFNPLLALLDQLESQYKQEENIDINKYLYFEFLAVSQQYRGKKSLII